MRQSLKTRLLSAAYKAACAFAENVFAFAENVFAFTESIRMQKEDSYLDDLYDRRDALAEGLRESVVLLDTLERHRDNVRAELDITDREINGPTYTPTCTLHKVRDFDDLPAPQGVDEDEAPEGYKAVVSAPEQGCGPCAFDPTAQCPQYEGDVGCTAAGRGDGQNVVFVKR